MRQPRRIFRGSSYRRPAVSRTMLAFMVAVLGTGAAVMTAMSTDLFGYTPPPPSHAAADPDQVAVIDGETLRLDGQIVRLRGVDAPMRGDRCSGATDCGASATAVLAGLVRGRRVECTLADRDDAGRPYASCQAGGTDLSRAIVASGWARAQANAPGLADLELRARRQRSGLWADAGGS